MAEINPVVTSTPVGQAKPEVIADNPSVTVEAKPDPQSQESFSKRFSALNRERKELSQREVEIKKKAAALEAKEAQVKEWEDKQAAVKNAKNPIEALKAFGFSYEDAAKYMLNDERPTPDLMIKSVEEKVAALEKQLADERAEKTKIQLESEKEKLTKESQAQNQQAIDAIKTHLEAKPEFDALIALGMHDDIFNQINEHYNATGEVLQIDDLAANMMKKVEEMLGVVTKTNIYKSKFSNQKAPASPKTLSNSLNAQTQPPEKKTYKTDDERVRNALAMLSK